MPQGPAAHASGPRAGSSFGLGLALLGLVGLSLAGFAVLGVHLMSGAPSADDDTVASTAIGTSSDGYRVWDRNDDGTPVRWDPCRTLEIVVNDEGSPSGWRHDLTRAIDEVADHTGMDIQVVGSSDERPIARRDAYQPTRYGDRWAPVLVAWAEPGEGDLPMLETDRGIAIPVAVGVEGDRTYVTGQVVLNRQRGDLHVGFDDRAVSWGSTLLHELGHLLGLAHVDDPDEIMARHPGEGLVRFGPGDREGLRAVGRDQGCRDVLTPQPVDVPDPTTELDLLREHRRSDRQAGTRSTGRDGATETERHRPKEGFTERSRAWRANPSGCLADAPVHRQGDAGDPAGRIRQQEHDRTRDVFGGA